MTKVVGDVAFNGFGSQEGIFVAPVGAAARIYRIIRASQGRVDLQGIDFYALIAAQASANIYVSYIQVFRSSLSVTDPPSVLGGVQMPPGVELLWGQTWEGNYATNATHPTEPESQRSFRFPPGTVSAAEGQQLFVVATQVANAGGGAGAAFPGCTIGLSAIGIDYSNNQNRNQTLEASLPRFDLPSRR